MLGKKQTFLSGSELAKFAIKPLGRGGKLQGSSIRIELPDFLEDSYNYGETYYQEHAKITANIPPDLTTTITIDYNKERKRSAYFNIRSLSKPQPIKKRRVEAIPIHFFLANGARPHQRDTGILTDVPGGIKFAPIRNVEFQIYRPKLDDSWFDKIKKNTFLKDEIRSLVASRNSKGLESIEMLVGLFNSYNSLRRLSSSSGTVNSKHIPSEIEENLDANGDFYRKLSSAWKSVQDGNDEFKTNFQRLKSKLSVPVLNNFTSTTGYANNNEAFSFKMQLESITIPLKISRLENDETLYILTDLDVRDDEQTNVDGMFNKKVMGKIDMKLVKDLKSKKEKNFVQTFSNVEESGESGEGHLVSYPITINRLHDIQRYKFFLVNSKFQPTHVLQSRSTTDTSKWQVETITIMCKFFMHTDLHNV